MQNPLRGPSVTAYRLLAGFHSLCLPMEACPKAGVLILSLWGHPRNDKNFHDGVLKNSPCPQLSQHQTPQSTLCFLAFLLPALDIAGMPGQGHPPASSSEQSPSEPMRCVYPDTEGTRLNVNSSLVTSPHSPVLWSCSCAWEYLLPNPPLRSLLLRFHHFPKPSEMTRESNIPVER